MILLRASLLNNNDLLAVVVEVVLRGIVKNRVLALELFVSIRPNMKDKLLWTLSLSLSKNGET